MNKMNKVNNNSSNNNSGANTTPPRLLLLLLPLLLLSLLSHAILNVTAMTKAEAQLRAQQLLTANSTRSIWSFNGIQSTHSTYLLPPSIPQPPPVALGYYNTAPVAGFLPVHLNGKDQYIDLLNPVQDGGSKAFTGPVGAGAKSWSLATWLYVETLSHASNVNATVLLSCSSGTSPIEPRDFMLIMDNSGNILLRAAGGFEPVYGDIFAGRQAFKEWVHIGIVFDSKAQRYSFYYNGGLLNIISQSSFGVAYDTQASYCKLGQSDLIVVAQDMQPFRGAFFALAFYQGEALSTQDMWALSAPRSAKGILEMTPYTWKTLKNQPLGSTTTNLLTLNPDFIWSQFQTLSFSSNYLNLSTQIPNPAVATNIIGGTQPWAIIWWQQLPGTPKTVQTVWSFNNAGTGDLMTLTLSASAMQLTHSTIGSWNAFTYTGGAYIGTTLVTPITQWVLLSLVFDGTGIASYINSDLTNYKTPATHPARWYPEMYIGKTSGSAATLVAKVFGFSMFTSAAIMPALAAPEIVALAEPTSVSFDVNGPTIASPAATIMMTITMTSALKSSGNTTLVVQGGASSAHDALLTTITLLFSTQSPQTVSFLVPMNVNTYTITFSNSLNDPLLSVPQPWCIQVIDTTPAQIFDIGLTSFTATDFLASSDYHLELSSVATLPSSPPLTYPGPSGILGSNILTFDGATQYLNLNGSMHTMPFPGINNITSFTITVWIKVFIQTPPIVSIIFYHSVNDTNSDYVMLYIEALSGHLHLRISEAALQICDIQSSLPFPMGNEWHHATAQMGNGGCSLFVDGEQSLNGGIFSYTDSWSPFWQPLVQQLPHVLTFIGSDSLPPLYQPLNGSIATFDLFQRALTPREVAFLASNKPTSLLPPLPTPRIITVPNVMSVAKLYDDALLGMFSLGSLNPLHAILMPGPNTPTATGGGGYVWKFDNTTYSADLTSALDATSGKGPIPKTTTFSKTLPWSVGVWLMPEQTSASTYYVFNIQTSSSSSIASLTINPNAELVFNYTNSASKALLCSVRSSFAILGATSVSPQQWIHVHTVYDPRTVVPTCAVYVNGRMAGLSQIIATPTTQILGAFVLGGQTVSTALAGKFYGQVTSFIFFTRVVTKQEIFILGTATPAAILPPVLPSNQPSPAARILANSEFDWVSTGPITPGAPGVDLSGGADLPDAPRVLSYSGVPNSGYTDFLVGSPVTYSMPPFRSPSLTISMWVSWTSTTGCFFYSAISGQSQISLAPDPSSVNNLLFNILNCDPTTGQCVQVCALTLSSQQQLLIDTMYHLVAQVPEDGSCKLFVNGILSATSPGTDLSSAPSFGVRPIIPDVANVGACDTGTSERLNGKVAQLTIWQKELSDIEIAVLAAEPPLSVRALFPSLQQYLPSIATPVVEWTFEKSGANYVAAGGIVSLTPTNKQYIDLLSTVDNPSSGITLPPVFGGLSQSFSISMWIQISAQTIVTNMQVFECSSADKLHQLIVSIDSNNNYKITTNIPNYSASLMTPQNTFLQGRWHLLTLVFDSQSGTLKVQVNSGVVLYVGSIAGLGSISRLVTHNFCRIGSASNVAYPRLNFGVGYVAFHNIALSPQDVLTMYRNPPVNVIPLLNADSLINRLLSSAAAAYTFPTAPSASSWSPSYSARILTFTPNATTFAPQYTNLLSSDNTGSFGNSLPLASISNLVGGGFTLSMWLKFSTVVGNQRLFDLITPSNISDTRFSMQVNGGVVTIAVRTTGAVTCTLPFSNFTTKAGQWNLYSIILLPDARGMLYVDNALKDNVGTGMQCISSLKTNVAQTLLLPINAFISAYFGGFPSDIDGIAYRGFSGSLAGLFYFTRQLLPSEINLLYINPPVVDMLTPSPPTVSSTYSWRFQLATQSPIGYKLAASKNAPASFGKFNNNAFLDLTKSLDRPLNDRYLTSRFGGVLGTSTVFSMWMRYDSSGFVPVLGTNYVLFEFSTNPTNYNGDMVLSLNFDAQNQTYLLFSQVLASGASTNYLDTERNILKAGEWKLITLVVTLGAAHPVGSNVRIYVNAGLVAISSIAYAQTFSITRAVVNIDPDIQNTGVPLSLADVTIINSTTPYTHAQVWNAWINRPQSLLGSAVKFTLADQLLLSAAAIFTCSQRVNTSSVMDWIPGRSEGSGLCVFNSQLNSVSNAAAKGSHWDLNSPLDNPDHTDMPMWTTDPRIVGDGSGLTFSFHMTFQSLPIQGETMPLFICETSQEASDDLYFTMTYASATTTNFSLMISRLKANPASSLSVTLKNSDIPVNEVVHLSITVVSIDATPSWQTQIHFNGRLVGSTATYSGLANSLSFTDRDLCYVGLDRRNLVTGATNQFIGSVGQIAFFSRGLSLSEIRLLAINPPAAYVQSQTLVVSLPFSQEVDHYVNRPMTCGTRTMQHFQTWDRTNTGAMNAVSNLPAMQCATPAIVNYGSAKGLLNTTLIDCINTKVAIPTGEVLSYVGLIPQEAGLEANSIWLGIDTTYIRTQIEDIGIFIGPNLLTLNDFTSLLTPPSSPLSIFTYQAYLPVLQSLGSVWLFTYCASPCVYYYKGTKLTDGQNSIQLTGLNVGTNVVKLYSSSVPAMNYSITLIIPPLNNIINPCQGVVCANGGTCLQQASQVYAGYPYTCQCVGLWTGPLCADPIVPPSNPPVAVMYISQTVTDCDTLYLDGRQSYNLGPASVHPRWLWGLLSIQTSAGVEIYNTSSSKYNAAVAAQTFVGAQPNTLNASTVFTQDSLILIAGSRLIDNCTYRFGLQIVNDVDQSKPVRKDVLKLPTAQVGWTPSMVVRVPTNLRRPNSATTTATLTPSTCLAYPLDLQYSYTWQAQITGALYPPSAYYPAINSLPANQALTTSSASSFVVPAGFWRTGYTYTISLNLILSSASGIISPTQRRRLLASQSVALNYLQANLTVTSTAVIAKITNGDRTRANTDELIITADQSYDPDFPLSTGQSPLIGVTFMWSCRVSGGGGGGIGCALPVTVNLTRPSVTIPPSTLSAGFSYIWSVNVTSIMDGRWSVSSSVNVTLTVPLTVSVPLVTILAPPTRINIDDELRVQATVVSETTTNPIAMSYVWSIRLDNSSLPAAVPPLPSLYDPTNLANGVGVNTSSLVLLSNRLVSGIYRLTVTVTDPFTIDPVSKLPVSGYANIVFRVNSKPQPGECHISATTTTGGGYYALLTPFSVVCSSWYSNTGDEPFTYQISYVTSEAVAAAAAANAANTPVSYLQLTPESFAPTSVQFFLPAAGSFIIRATIKDQVGSEANVDLPLTVDTPIVVFDLLEYIRNLTEVELPPLVASGSTQSAMLLASRIGDLINGARVTMSSSSSSSSGNSSSDSDSAAQDRLTLYNRECLIQLSLTWKQIMIQTNNIIDLASMNLIIQAMLPLTKYASSSTTSSPRYYSNDTLTVALQLIGDVITAADLSTMTHKILSISTTQDLGTILSQLFVECSSLDFIDHSLHTVLHIRQRDAVAGEEISLSTLNFIGFVSRSLVSAGTEVHLSNGQSVILTSKQMETYVAQLEQLNSTSIDTASYPLGTAEMDTRIITFASQWNQCRNKASLSQLTSIELTFPNGDPIDIGSLGSGITFTLPLPKNVSDPILQLIQDDQRRQYEERCGTSDGFIPTTTTTTNVTEDELLSHFQCQFYNTTTHQYSSDGCTTLNATRVDPPGLGGGGGVLLTCQCTHLTEFAILYQEAQSRDRNDGCPATATSLGDSSYLIFLVLYALVGLAALIQLIRSIVFFGVKKYWLITIEHTLMFLMCLARSYNMAMYYSLYTKLSIFTQSLLSGIPYLFYPWIFTFVIVAWASVLAAASQGQHRSNLFKPYAVQFILGNSFISLVIFFIFISMAVTNDLDTLTQLQRAGIGVTCAVEIGFAIFFVIYGSLLVHELTKTFVSKHALKLGGVAGSLAAAFAVSAALLAFSVAQPEKYDEHFVAYNCVYFSLDIIGLLIVMGLFAKSISRGEGQSKTKEVSTSNHSNTGGSNRTGTNGAKASSGGRSSNGGGRSSAGSKNGGSKHDIEMGGMKQEAARVSVPRALPATNVSSPSNAASTSPPSPPPADGEQNTPPDEQVLQISPLHSPQKFDFNDPPAIPEDDDIVLPPRPEMQLLQQQSSSSPHHHEQHSSSSPPPMPSSMMMPSPTPVSPSLTGSKRLPPPIPMMPQSPSMVASPSAELEEVHVEQQQNDF